jgi:hypothetical protein
MCGIQIKGDNRLISLSHTGMLSYRNGASTASTLGIPVKTARRTTAKANIEENTKLAKNSMLVINKSRDFTKLPKLYHLASSITYP